MSQAITALAVGPGARFGVQISQASPGLETFKRGDLSSSLSRAAYVHSKGHLLICKRPLYAVDRQCSFVAFAMQRYERQNGNNRKMTNQKEKIYHKNMNVTKSNEQTETKNDTRVKELLASFPVSSNGRKRMEKKMNHKHINPNQYNRNDMQDDREHLQPEIQSSFPEDSKYPKVRHKSKSSSTDASNLREIVDIFNQAKSKPEEGSYGEGQRIQMSDDKTDDPVNAVLRVLQQFSQERTADENRSQKFADSSRNGKPRTRSLKGKFSQSVAPVSNSIQKSSLTNKLGFDRPPSHFSCKSPIAPPVVRQQEQVVYGNSQSGDTEFEDCSLNVGHRNEMQLKSDMEYSAPEYDDLIMPDTSSITAVKTIESECLINGTPVELSDTLSNSSVEKRDSESLLNGAAAQPPSLLIEQKDLSTLKLSELKLIAKSRGLKGFSKFKKAELLGLLRQGTN